MMVCLKVISKSEILKMFFVLFDKFWVHQLLTQHQPVFFTNKQEHQQQKLY